MLRISYLGIAMAALLGWSESAMPQNFTGSLFKIHYDGSIWRATGTPCTGGTCPGWQKLGNNPASSSIVAGTDSLFQLRRDGSVWRYTWTPCNSSGTTCAGWVALDHN